MRDLVSCFSEHAIKISDTSCSASSAQLPSTQNTVSCLYKSNLSPHKHLLITVTWCNSSLGQGLIIAVDSDPSHICKSDAASHQSWKKKGSKSFECAGTKIDLFWDLSSACYASGAEPVDSFYVAVVADDTQLCLLLGDIIKEDAIRRFNTSNKIVDFFLLARREHVFGRTTYVTKARFCDGGADHEIVIKCRGENGVVKDPELCVSIDQKKVIHVKRLRWKFRGNQTIFVDGLPVDMMWDVHDWLFSPGYGNGVFMFRRRSGFESKLLLEEKVQQREDSVGFSLLIYACKSP